MKILVVEGDNRQFLRLKKKSLSDAGHEVHCARDGDSALAMYKTLCPFDVVVTNGLFPKRAWSGDRVVEVAVRKGTHLIECIRAIDPGQPFIVRAESESMEVPRGVPMLRKPYKIGRLMRMLASAGSQRLPLFDHPLTVRPPDACAGEAFIYCRVQEKPREGTQPR
jgi:CheY-like chemotaxis protein